MSSAKAIIIGAALIAVAILFVFRWQITATQDYGVIRLDRWTGSVTGCAVADNRASQLMACSAR